MSTLSFVSFPSIEGFHNVIKSAERFFEITDPEPLQWPYRGYTGPLPRGHANYRGKIKLHGTNAGIRICGNQVAAQSRTQIITPQADNVGFARWVESNLSYWSNLTSDDITVFGEWCGPGIMKGTAINQIPHKAFVVFAIIKGQDSGLDVTPVTYSELISEPAEIEAILKDRPADVHILPWYGEVFSVDYTDRVSLQNTADRLNNVVAEVEPMDPWVKSVFGVEGTAEGVVYYPGAGETLPRPFFSSYAFKAKGEKHKGTKTREAVQVDPEVVASVDAFVDMFVTEARLEQGLAAVGALDMKNIGAFLKWISTDVAKESEDELEVADLTWDQVQKQVQTAARTWFLTKYRTL